MPINCSSVFSTRCNPNQVEIGGAAKNQEDWFSPLYAAATFREMNTKKAGDAIMENKSDYLKTFLQGISAAASRYRKVIKATMR